MSIQGNVNQIISLSTLLATTSPQYKAAGEKRVALRANKQALKAVEDRIAFGVEHNRAKDKPGAMAPVLNERADLLHERYKLKPTMENWEAFANARLEANERADVEKRALQGDINQPMSDLTGTPEMTKEAFQEKLEGDYEQYLYEKSGIEPIEVPSKAPQEAPKTSTETTKKSPSMQAHEDATKALEEAQGARRIGRISTDWRPYM